MAKKENVDYRTTDGFRKILPKLTADVFKKESINFWGTTIRGVMSVYAGSPSEAVLDLIQHDAEFDAIKKQGLQPYDFVSSPKNTWIDKQGKPTQIAREATGLLIRHIAKKENVDYRTTDGFRKILPQLTKYNFNKESINYWGTTLCGMIQYAYTNSTSAAIIDLIEHDNEFIELRLEY